MEHSKQIGGADVGNWVVVATLDLRSQNIHPVPVWSLNAPFRMRRFKTAEEATAGSMQHAAVRIGGGWALNVVTGATVPIKPMSGR
jgi:hypothetical protein